MNKESAEGKRREVGRIGLWEEKEYVSSQKQGPWAKTWENSQTKVQQTRITYGSMGTP